MLLLFGQGIKGMLGPWEYDRLVGLEAPQRARPKAITARGEAVILFGSIAAGLVVMPRVATHTATLLSDTEASASVALPVELTSVARLGWRAEAQGSVATPRVGNASAWLAIGVTASASILSPVEGTAISRVLVGSIGTGSWTIAEPEPESEPIARKPWTTPLTARERNEIVTLAALAWRRWRS